MTFNDNQFPKFVNLPPKVPSDPEDMNRAVCLLGNRLASDLKEKSKNELIFLLGAYPSPEQAKLWKHALKKMLKNNFVVDPEPALPPTRPPATKQSNRKSSSKRSRRQSSTSESQSSKNRSRHQSVSDRLMESDYYLGVSNLASINLDMFRDDDDGFDD